MKRIQPTFKGRVSCLNQADFKLIFFYFHKINIFSGLLICAAMLFFFPPDAAGQQSLPAGSAQQADKVAPQIKDNGYFKYAVTGDEQIDAENYRRAKEEFAKNHPDQYEKMIKEEAVQEKHVIDGKEFEQMPEERRNHILANPDKYTIKQPD